MGSRDDSVRVGVLHSLVRVEEKMLFAELEKRGVNYTRVDDLEITLPFERPADTWPFDVVLERNCGHRIFPFPAESYPAGERGAEVRLSMSSLA